MKKLKSIDSLVYMLMREEERGTDKKMIQYLREKIQEVINYNNNILYGIK